MTTHWGDPSAHVRWPRGFVRGVVLSIFVGLVVGCVPQPVKVKTAQEFVPARIRSVAIVPFQAIATPQAAYHGSTYPPPESGETEYLSSFESSSLPVPGRLSHQKNVTIPPGAPPLITQLVFEELQSRPGLRVMPMAQTKETVQRLMSSAGAGNRVSMARQVGQALDVDAVLIGLVRVYREREGSRLGALPAAVGFEARLIDTTTGTVVWAGDFFEEQKPLTEDIRGFIEHGMAFVTAKEIAQLGVKKMMSRLPIGNRKARETTSSP